MSVNSTATGMDLRRPRWQSSDMNFAEIRQALETAPRMPEAALRDAAAHTDELAPLVIELIEKLEAGVYLLPEQAQLLFYGVHVLAAARARALWPAWCALMRLPDEVIVDLFGDDDVVTILIAVTASLVEADAPAIVALLETDDLSSNVRWALFPVLARLTWQGHADLADTAAFLTRFAEEERVEPGDWGWHGWLDAVVLLGLVDLVPLVEVVLAEQRLAAFNAADRTEALERLAAAAANFADEGRFLEDHTAPFDDPVEGLWWLRAREAREEEWLAELGDEELDEPFDPAADIALTAREEGWLRGFLASPQVPPTALNFEALDGFFCALVVGPEPVMPSEYMPHVWGGLRPAEGPVYDNEAQLRFATDLFTRYWNMIARRIADGVGHEPFLYAAAEAEEGRAWSLGFTLGVMLRQTAWQPLSRNRKVAMFLGSIVALSEDETPPDLRQDILENLPGIVLAIARFWRRAGQQRVRSEKIGRNQLCPCGSGRKYKKCCGATPPPSLH
jgi:uncharacterized protein